MTKPTLRRRIARLAVAVAGFAVVWACNAPFIPVPPPAGITFTSSTLTDAAGTQHTVWTTHGPANAQAVSSLYYIFDVNRDAGVIVGAAADGSFDAPAFEGAADDHVRIHFQVPGGEASEEACKLLREGADPPDCP